MTTQETGDLSVHEGLVAMQRSWSRLMATMTRGPKDHYARKTDERGWTALDHLAHVSAWERSRLTWLQGRPRFEGLGVSSAEFRQDYDALNELVRAQTDGHTYDQILDAARSVHQAMVAEVQSFDPDDVDHAGGIERGEIARLGTLLKENLADHYDEHREYIERILAS